MTTFPANWTGFIENSFKSHCPAGKRINTKQWKFLCHYLLVIDVLLNNELTLG